MKEYKCSCYCEGEKMYGTVYLTTNEKVEEMDLGEGIHCRCTCQEVRE